MKSLVLSHLRLAWSLAMETSIPWIDPEDLLQAANTALVFAAKKYTGTDFGLCRGDSSA